VDRAYTDGEGGSSTGSNSREDDDWQDLLAYYNSNDAGCLNKILLILSLYTFPNFDDFFRQQPNKSTNLFMKWNYHRRIKIALLANNWRI
jgi:hypothetical protein